MDRKIELRKAVPGDDKLIFKWRNSSYLIRLGTSNRKVTWDEHSNWFQDILRNAKNELFIILFNNKSAGQLRFELKDNCFVVTIYLDKVFTGIGIGTESLRKGCELIIKKYNEGTFLANVKSNNKASINMFKKVDFEIADRAHIKGHTTLKRNFDVSLDYKDLMLYYKKNIRNHKQEYEILGWGSKNSQEKRFEIFKSICDLEEKSILDVGCGIGDFYSWLNNNNLNVNYYGIDIIPEMISLAKVKHPNQNFHLVDIIFDNSFEKMFDIVFASGIFNIKIKNHENFLKRMIIKMYSKCKLALGFNILSDNADFKGKREYYANPNKLLNFCKSISDNVIMKDDYMSHDVTYFLYKK